MIIFNNKYIISKSYTDFLEKHNISSNSNQYQKIFNHEVNLLEHVNNLEKKLTLPIQIIILEKNESISSFSLDKKNIYFIFPKKQKCQLFYNKNYNFNSDDKKTLDKIIFLIKKQILYKHNNEIQFFEHLDIILNNNYPKNWLFYLLVMIIFNIKSIGFIIFIFFLLYKSITYTFCVFPTHPLLAWGIILTLVFCWLFIYNFLIAMWFDFDKEVLIKLWFATERKIKREQKRIKILLVLFIFGIISFFSCCFYIIEFKNFIQKDINNSLLWNIWICKNIYK